MTTINTAFVSPGISPEFAPAATPTPPARAVQPEVATAAQEPAKQSSLAQRALAASRTCLKTAELSTPGHVRAAPSARATLAHSQGARRKDELYPSPKRPELNLNTKVVLPASERDTDTFMARTVVACRHLAFEYFKSPKKSLFLNAVKDTRSIERHFSGGRLRAANLGYQQLTSAATLRNSSIVTADMFPERLMDIAEIMTHSGPHTADFLITTSNHVLALNIKIKEGRRVCVSVYDPNMTTNHARVEGANYADTEALQSADVPLDHHRKLGNHAFTIHAQQNFFQPEDALDNLRASSQSPPVQVMASFINNALDRDDPALLLKLIEHAGRKHHTDRRELKTVMAATEDGVPGMFNALQNGRTHTVQAWMAGTRQLAQNGLLKGDDVYELFKPRISRGSKTSGGLFLAMCGQQTETVAAYMGQVTDTAAKGLLTSAQVKALFSVTDSIKNPGIDAVWRNRDLATLRAVVHHLERCHQHKVLAAGDIKELLLGKGPEMKKGTLSPAESAAFKQALQPLIDKKLMKASDVDDIFTARGLGEKAVKQSLLSRVFN